MRLTVGVVSALLVATAAVQGRENIEITATKKTRDTSKGGEQDLWRGTSRAVEKLVYYEIGLKSWSAGAPSDVNVEWLILVEGAGGRVFPGTFGSRSLALSAGQAATLETDDVKLEGREWTDGLNPGTVKDEIAGYGIRVRAADGAVLAEKYEPPSVKSRVDWNLLDESRGEKIRKLPPRLRPLQAP